MSTKTILLVSDTHVGDGRALVHPKVPRRVGLGEDDYEKVELNKLQRYFYRCWEYMISQLPSRIDILVFTGDLIQGHKNPWGLKLTLPRIDDQVNHAEELFRPLAERAKYKYVLAGTRAHSLDIYDAEREIARRIGAKYDFVFNLRVKGKLFNILHGKTQPFVYKGSGLEREILFAALMAEMRKVPKADVVIRGHIHKFVSLCLDKKMGMFLPCWQYASDYAAVKTASWFAHQPDLGAVLLEVEEGDLPDSVKIHRAKFSFDPPKVAMKVEEIG